MRIGHLEAGFPYGLLVVADSGADMAQLPEASFHDSRIVTGPGIVLYAVMNEQDGDVEVDIIEENDTIDDGLVAAETVIIDVPSGELIVSDAEGANAAFVDVKPGPYMLKVFADDPEYAEKVVLQLSQR